MTTRGQGRTAIEHTNVVQSQKAPFKDVVALFIFAVYPPREVDQQFGEGVLEKFNIPLAVIALSIDGVNLPGGPGMNGRIDIAKVPLVGRNLTIRVQVIFPQHQHQLLFGKVLIHQA